MNKTFFSKMNITIVIIITLYAAALCAYMTFKHPKEGSISRILEPDIEAYKDLKIKDVEKLVHPAQKCYENRIEANLKENLRLSLRLVGIFVSGKDRVACIEDIMSSGTGKYKVGDSVRGAVVVSIFSGEVLLVRNGERVVLRLSDTYAWDDIDDWIAHVSENSFIVSSKRLGLRLGNINKLLSEAVPVVNVKNGKIDGFRISSLKKDGFIATAGFKKDDIIKKVNGLKIDSLRKPIQLYKELRNLVKNDEPIICIEFERDSEIQSSTYRILRN